MNGLSTVVLLAALVAPLIGSTADDVARGCSHTPSGLWVRPYTSSIMIDGVLLHTGWDSGPEGSPLGGLDLSAEEIVHIWPGCLDFVIDGGTVGVRVVSVITRDGAVGVMRSFLRDLAVSYREDVALAGPSAEVLARSSQFYASRPPVPIQLASLDGIVTARIGFDGFETSCQVSWSVLHAEQGDTPAAEVLCQQRDGEISE